MLILWMLLHGSSVAGCEVDGPLDAAFEVQPPRSAERVQLLLELWADEDHASWADSMMRVLEARDLQGTLAVPIPSQAASAELLSLAARASDAGHEVVVRLNAAEVPQDLRAPVGEIKARARTLRKGAGRIRGIITPLPTRGSEALLGKAGFQTLLQADSDNASPRLAAVFEGRPSTHVVLPPGPYREDCGTYPRWGPFTPAAADQSAHAIHAAIRAEGAPVVRVALDGRRGAETDAEVLGRWLDEVILPLQIPVRTPSAARQAARAALRKAPPLPPPQEAGGRRVNLAEIEQAAERLKGVQILPRTLPGELNLSEALHGFLLVLADRAEGDVIRLGALRGPPNFERSALGQDDIVQIPREAVVRFAGQLLAELPDTMPVSMRVGGHLLTAPELLGLLASAVRGEDPAITRISASPEPNARGQGWGDATLP